MKYEGTVFQIQVWKEIIKIPKGCVKTYKEIAIIIGNPKSSRAVANACGKIHAFQLFLVIELLDQMEN